MIDRKFLAEWVSDIEKAIPSLTEPAEQSVRERLARQLEWLTAASESEHELVNLLRHAYRSIPEDRKGRSRCIDYDPAGSTYEFTEYEWSVRSREILGIMHEPTGI